MLSLGGCSRYLKLRIGGSLFSLFCLLHWADGQMGLHMGRIGLCDWGGGGGYGGMEMA